MATCMVSSSSPYETENGENIHVTIDESNRRCHAHNKVVYIKDIWMRGRLRLVLSWTN